jgi:secondary thiamine-phosphate synthase enzyme
MLQTTLTLAPRPRGFHLITGEVVHAMTALRDVQAGLLHVFLQHTSASLCLGENASPDVRADLDAYFRRVVPDAALYFRHTEEGPDDMSAHVKAALLGQSLTLPVSGGRLALGTWQGIYLGEHRAHGGPRRLVLTLVG